MATACLTWVLVSFALEEGGLGWGGAGTGGHEEDALWVPFLPEE